MNESSYYTHQLFLVAMGNRRYICWATNRENAKRDAETWIGGNKDSYVVSPLSEKGDQVRIALTLAI